MARLISTKGGVITVVDTIALTPVFSNLEVNDATLSGLTSGEVDITHYGSGSFIEFAKEARSDPGNFEFTMNFDDEDVSNVVGELTKGTLSTIEYTFPVNPDGGVTPASFTFDGFMVDYNLSLPVSGGISLSVSYRVAQNLSFTDAT